VNRKITFILFLIFLVLPALSKYHPEIKWREIAKNKFIIVYPLGYEKEAFYTLEAAPIIYNNLYNIWGNHIKNKIRIVLTDAYDESNGNATFFPFNQIEIYLFNPPPDSSIGNCKDWIKMVLSHEMTHLFNFHSGSKFIRFLRKIFGHNPLLFPFIQTPVWVTEGLAIFGESQLNQGGRLNTPNFNIILSSMVKANYIPNWRNIYGEPTFWPGPESKYLFGSKFIQFLAERYGNDKIPEFIKYYTKFIVTLHSPYRFHVFFKKRLSVLWKEFKNSIKISQNPRKEKMKRLTNCGMYKQYPVVISENKCIFARMDFKEYPGLWEINLKNQQMNCLIKRSGINSLSYSKGNHKIYFSATDYSKTFYVFSDIYEYDIKKKIQKQLSKGSRLFYPVKLPESKFLYCVKRKKTKSYLAIFDLEEQKEKIISDGFEGISFLSISPDKKHIATSLKRKNKNWNIAVFDKNGKLIRTITRNKGKHYYPVWKNNHELYYITEYQNNYCLAMFSMIEQMNYIYNENALPAIKYFSFLPDHDFILSSIFDSNGDNFGLVNITTLKREKIPLSKNDTMNEVLQQTLQFKTKKYNSLRDLIPKYFNFSYRYGGNDIQPGLLLTGTDALSIHSFTLEGFYGIKTNTFNLGINYTYEGLYPTIMINLTNYSDLNRSQENEEYIYSSREIAFVSIYPLHYTERHQSYIYTDIHFEKITEKYLTSAEKSSVKLNGIKVGFLFLSAQKYYDSFSQSDGISFSLTYSKDMKTFGSDYNLNTVAFEFKQYISLFRPNVLAFRFGVSNSWGEAQYLFYMGGANSKEDFHIAGDNMFDLMRGFPSGYFSGSGGFIINLEYRMLFAKLERKILISRSIEQFYLSIFADIGNLWNETKKLNPSYSFGLEMNMVILLGKRVTLTGGVAYGKNPVHSPVFYFRIGKSF